MRYCATYRIEYYTSRLDKRCKTERKARYFNRDGDDDTILQYAYANAQT